MTEEAKIKEARNTWEAAAPGWAKWEQTISQGLEPVTDVLLDMAGVSSGARVLDVASGAGHQTLQAARRVGPTGSVVASDISSTMLENVRRNHLQERILVVNGRAEEHLGYPADLLVANIHYDVMRHLVRDPDYLEKPWFILSGMLRSDAKRISDYLANRPVTILDRWSRDGIWHTILGKSRKH